MRVLLLLIAVATAGCLLLDEDLPEPEQEPRIWHLSSDVVLHDMFCGDCHYGMTEMWLADWTQDDAGWQLKVSPRWAEAPLYAVQVGELLESSGWLSANVQAGDTHTITFDGGDADHVLFKAYGSGPSHDALALTANRQDEVVTQVTLTAPDGTVYEADGPEQDLRIIVAPGASGTWSADVTLVEGAPTGSVHALYELLAGDVVPYVDDAHTFRFPSNETGAPPEVHLRIQPHHDHAAFQNSEWDAMDSTPFDITYTPQAGPAPVPREWNETEIDALWVADEYLFHEFGGSWQAIYQDEPGHNDLGVGGSYPGFSSPDGSPVLPGTDAIRLELTWTPATEEPALKVKFSPAHWVYFLYPDSDVRGPGFATFEIPIIPMWWESPNQTLEWLEPGRVRSYYDIAPYLVEDGEIHAVDLDFNLKAYAVRY